MVRFLRCGLWLCLCLVAPGARAQTDQRPIPTSADELKRQVVRGVEAAVGAEVRVEDVRYELLAARFVGQGIEIGPAATPFLSLPRLTVELAWLSQEGATMVRRIEAQEPRATIPSSWLERPFQRPRQTTLNVRTLGVTRGTLALVTEAGCRLMLEDANVTLSDGVVAASGAAGLGGSFSIAARHFRLGELTLSDLLLEGKLESGRIRVRRLTLSGLGGRGTFRGTVSLKGDRLGAVALRGSVEVRPMGNTGPRLSGPVTLRGTREGALILEGALRTTARLPPQTGTTSSSPPLKLRLRIGDRLLRGTLGRWVLR